jgi:3-oxoacyl-[acyl-carrier protein] reductase
MKDNITWITGASTGIGKELAYVFNENKKNIAVTARREELLKNIMKECSSNAKVLPIKMDVADSKSVFDTEKKISQKFNIDCVINNAGVTSFTKAEDDSIEQIDEIINTNLLGSIYVIKSVLPNMIKNKKGTIVNILSAAAVKIFLQSSAYAASKAGLLTYTNVLREELRNYNIKVINIIPGATKTPIWPNSALEKYSERMMLPQDVANMIFNLTVLDKNMVPEEIVLKPIKGDL